MSKTTATIGLATAIVYAAIVLTPMNAMAQSAPLAFAPIKYSQAVKTQKAREKAQALRCTKTANAHHLQGKLRKNFIADCKKEAN
jgi:hypothetical protein